MIASRSRCVAIWRPKLAETFFTPVAVAPSLVRQAADWSVFC